jgi:DNA polymerase-3 subunit alpha
MASKNSNDPEAGPFIHLRVHSAFSLLEGAIKIPALVALTKKHKMPAVAITDSGNLFGSLEFSLEAAKNGIQPIIGCSIQLEIENDKYSRPKTAELLLLAKNHDGYQNLLKIW